MFVSALKNYVFCQRSRLVICRVLHSLFGTLYSTIMYIISKHGLCAQMVECESNCRCAHNQVNRQKKQNYSRLRSLRKVTSFAEVFYQRVWQIWKKGQNDIFSLKELDHNAVSVCFAEKCEVLFFAAFESVSSSPMKLRENCMQISSFFFTSFNIYSWNYNCAAFDKEFCFVANGSTNSLDLLKIVCCKNGR